MDSIRVQAGATELVKNTRFIDSARVGITGLSAKVNIYRNTAPRFWTGVGYGGSPTDLAMTAIDATNLPGEYVYAFDTAGASEEEHFVIAKSGTTLDARVINDMQEGSVVIGGWVDNLDAPVSEGRDYLRARKRVLAYSATASYEVLYATNGTTPERRWPIFRDAAGMLPVRDASDPIVLRGPEEAHP